MYIYIINRLLNFKNCNDLSQYLIKVNNTTLNKIYSDARYISNKVDENFIDHLAGISRGGYFDYKKKNDKISTRYITLLHYSYDKVKKGIQDGYKTYATLIDSNVDHQNQTFFFNDKNFILTLSFSQIHLMQALNKINDGKEKIQINETSKNDKTLKAWGERYQQLITAKDITQKIASNIATLSDGYTSHPALYDKGVSTVFNILSKQYSDFTTTILKHIPFLNNDKKFKYLVNSFYQDINTTTKKLAESTHEPFFQQDYFDLLLSLQDSADAIYCYFNHQYEIHKSKLHKSITETTAEPIEPAVAKLNAIGKSTAEIILGNGFNFGTFKAVKSIGGSSISWDLVDDVNPAPAGYHALKSHANNVAVLFKDNWIVKQAVKLNNLTKQQKYKIKNINFNVGIEHITTENFILMFKDSCKEGNFKIDFKARFYFDKDEIVTKWIQKGHLLTPQFLESTFGSQDTEKLLMLKGREFNALENDLDALDMVNSPTDTIKYLQQNPRLTEKQQPKRWKIVKNYLQQIYEEPISFMDSYACSPKLTVKYTINDNQELFKTPTYKANGGKIEYEISFEIDKLFQMFVDFVDPIKQSSASKIAWTKETTKDIYQIREFLKQEAIKENIFDSNTGAESLYAAFDTTKQKNYYKTDIHYASEELKEKITTKLEADRLELSGALNSQNYAINYITTDKEGKECHQLKIIEEEFNMLYQNPAYEIELNFENDTFNILNTYDKNYVGKISYKKVQYSVFNAATGKDEVFLTKDINPTLKNDYHEADYRTENHRHLASIYQLGSSKTAHLLNDQKLYFNQLGFLDVVKPELEDATTTVELNPALEFVPENTNDGVNLYKFIDQLLDRTFTEKYDRFISQTEKEFDIKYTKTKTNIVNFREARYQKILRKLNAISSPAHDISEHYRALKDFLSTGNILKNIQKDDPSISNKEHLLNQLIDPIKFASIINNLKIPTKDFTAFANQIHIVDTKSSISWLQESISALINNQSIRGGYDPQVATKLYENTSLNLAETTKLNAACQVLGASEDELKTMQIFMHKLHLLNQSMIAAKDTIHKEADKANENLFSHEYIKKHSDAAQNVLSDINDFFQSVEEDKHKVVETWKKIKTDGVDVNLPLDIYLSIHHFQSIYKQRTKSHSDFRGVILQHILLNGLGLDLKTSDNKQHSEFITSLCDNINFDYDIAQHEGTLIVKPSKEQELINLFIKPETVINQDERNIKINNITKLFTESKDLKEIVFEFLNSYHEDTNTDKDSKYNYESANKLNDLILQHTKGYSIKDNFEHQIQHNLAVKFTEEIMGFRGRMNNNELHKDLKELFFGNENQFNTFNPELFDNNKTTTDAFKESIKLNSNLNWFQKAINFEQMTHQDKIDMQTHFTILGMALLQEHKTTQKPKYNSGISQEQQRLIIEKCVDARVDVPNAISLLFTQNAVERIMTKTKNNAAAQRITMACKTMDILGFGLTFVRDNLITQSQELLERLIGTEETEKIFNDWSIKELKKVLSKRTDEELQSMIDDNKLKSIKDWLEFIAHDSQQLKYINIEGGSIVNSLLDKINSVLETQLKKHYFNNEDNKPESIHDIKLLQFKGEPSETENVHLKRVVKKIFGREIKFRSSNNLFIARRIKNSIIDGTMNPTLKDNVQNNLNVNTIFKDAPFDGTVEGNIKNNDTKIKNRQGGFKQSFESPSSFSPNYKTNLEQEVIEKLIAYIRQQTLSKNTSPTTNVGNHKEIGQLRQSIEMKQNHLSFINQQQVALTDSERARDRTISEFETIQSDLFALQEKIQYTVKHSLKATLLEIKSEMGFVSTAFNIDLIVKKEVKDNYYQLGFQTLKDLISISRDDIYFDFKISYNFLKDFSFNAIYKTFF